jgi:hypothetical protein
VRENDAFLSFINEKNHTRREAARNAAFSIGLRRIS